MAMKGPRTALATTTTAPAIDIKQVWVDYKKEKTERLRNTLMETYLHLVRYNAERIHVKLPDEVELDDLMSAGIFGLMDAINAFDLDRGVKFETYCAPRIRGAILDELRRQDHVPRSIRRKSRDIAQAREALMRGAGRAPTDHEVAGQLGIDVDTLWRWQADMERTVQVSLSTNENDRDDAGPAPIDVLPAAGDSAQDVLEQEEQVAGLRAAILGLKDQQRTVLSLYYFEELNAREIAEVLGISESRVSQIRTKALSQLRHVLSPMAMAG
jgi:RNA polymerase sigma factor for flagellar operon FliA